MQTILSSGLRVFGSSVAASAASLVSQLLVVVVARVARHDPRAAEAAGLAHELAFVVKTGVTVCAQAKLELGALLVALVFREVHEGNVLGVIGLFVVVFIVLVKHVGRVATCHRPQVGVGKLGSCIAIRRRHFLNRVTAFGLSARISFQFFFSSYGISG